MMTRMPTDDLTDLGTWLLEQIAEDDRVAGELAADGWPKYDGRVLSVEGTLPVPWPDRWNPVRVLAECDAKRRIVDLHTPEGRYLDCPTCTDRDYRTRRSDDDKQLWWCDTLKLLALPYSGRPGYREEWQP